MASDGAQMEVERRLRDIGARFDSLPGDNEELLRLIEEAETWLSRVDQSPPESMHKALRPTMSALINKELLDHSDPDVKLAVASCLTEVTRITAPEAPYDDDVMKDVFTRVIEAFEKLDDMESPSYARRVAMLETVAKVRSCVLMLDLDCDDLIRDMFHHFFRTISHTHQENVITSMETVMKFVIDESEDVHPDMPSCLLQDLASYLLKSVKKEEKETLPASFGLAEKVIDMCHEKLKPVFIPLLRGTPLDEYSKVVTSLFEDVLDAGVADSADAPGKDTVADKKSSLKLISDKSPQESSKSDQDANCPGKDRTPNNTSTSVVSNGGALVDRVKSPNGPSSSDKNLELPSDDKQAKDSDDLVSGAKEVQEPITTEPEKPKPSDHNLKKSHKLDSSTDSEVADHSKAVNSNEDILASGELSPERNDGDNKLPSETENRTADDKSKPVDDTPMVKAKRGRPAVPKLQEKKTAGKGKESSLESKKADTVSNSGGRTTRRLAKDDTKSSSKKTGEGESSKKQQKENSKVQEDTSPDDGTDEDLSLKDIVSPKASIKTGKNKGQPGDSAGSKRKRVQEAEETPQPKKNTILDGSLIGSRIKVWWPDDKKFYKGVVKSFDVTSKKHKVVYDDGDIERLQLKKEKWEFLDEGQDNNPDASSDMPRGRRGRVSSGEQTKQGKETPSSGKQLGTDGTDPPKKRGRPKAVRSGNSSPNDDSPLSSTRLKGKNAEKDEDVPKTPKTGSTLKNEGGRSSRPTGNTKDGLLKSSTKDETGSTKSANKSKNVTGSKHKDSKEAKSSESNPKGASTAKSADRSKTNGLSTKRKQKEKEVESSEEEEVSAKISTGKKRRRKAHN
ncbi:E3 ubiquitin-protein ligase RBBP6 isoform X2 [Oryza brachyantha]|uniref:E3 ubiquitin-protein ligase RBBP6 isoform X2 n=1 Tax=Oryza brachyantha TaxID=4533 RepID=UPI001ADA05CD|nr:E3 ubiquitin-protein ligase RBBP6 isoform X2 [Oryza brachyantha]